VLKPQLKKTEPRAQSAAQVKKAEGTTKPAAADGKKRGWGAYVCPVSSPEFLEHAARHKFVLILEPMTFRSGNFGWSKHANLNIEADGPNSRALDNKLVLTNVTCNAVVLPRYAHLSAARFMQEAEPLKITIDAEAYEFSTGSFGWEAHRRDQHRMCGEVLQVQVNLNAPVRGSKPKKPPCPSSDPVLKDLGPQVLSTTTWEVIGRATAKDKDDLKDIKGIGPFIEERLNTIGLYRFEQISKMTPAIEKEVTKAIVYFPGRHRRDDWIGQAKEKVSAARKKRSATFAQRSIKKKRSGK
jgi:hypothetical protein